MKTVLGSGPNALLARLFGALTLLFLGACALTPSAEPANTPDPDAVDIGYGTVDEEHVVGSVSTVRSEDVADQRYRSLAEMLRGQVSGIVVTELSGGGISVRIRGSGSFLGSKEPLWVVDGMIIQAGGQSLGSMNPNTVESITVLKDAGATAIYGSRGANGVILIKTKRMSP